MRKLLIILFLCLTFYAQSHSDSFIEYIKEVENSVKDGFKDGRWYPHKSVEGGSDTIAYGHKLKEGESFAKGLTESEALELLKDDLSSAEKLTSIYLKKHYSVEWSELPIWKQEIFIDFQFNGVLKSFPKFTKAVLCDDLAGMYREYKRYARTARGKRIELKERNIEFRKRYLIPLEKKKEKK